jgi:hypothetical protein
MAAHATNNLLALTLNDTTSPNYGVVAMGTAAAALMLWNVQPRKPRDQELFL